MITQLINEIKIALDNELYFVALNSALTLPDVCGKAEYPNSSTTKRYKDWVSKYIIDKIYSKEEREQDYPYLTADVLYSLRCSLLHQATPNAQNKENDLDEFVLTIEGTDDESFFHSEFAMISDTKKCYHLSLRYLCYLLRKDAQEYYCENKSRFDFINYRIKNQVGL